jgi:predicted extracellular nuclease
MLRLVRNGPGRLLAAVALVLAVMLPALGLGAYLSGAQAAAPPPPLKSIPASPASTSLVISQVYGGGGAGAGGSTYCNDFIELFNPTSGSISLSGKSVQYGSAANNMSGLIVLPGVSIPAGGYFLVQTGSNTTGTCTPLPTPDLNAGTGVNLSATSGKVGLFNATTLQACGSASSRCWPSNPALIDFVGYGSAADFEGNGPVPTLSATTAALRKSDGCQDTDDNVADFTVLTPSPRNSSSPPNTCTTGTATATATATNTAVVTGTPPTATSTPIPPSATVTRTPTQQPTPGPLRIRDIQGATHISPQVGQNVVNVPGIVTGKASNGFYFEDPSPDADVNTSEGLFVFTSSAPTVNVGDSVLVSGNVQEFRSSSPNGLTATELGSPTTILLSSGNPLPTPVVIGIGGRTPPNMIIEDDAGCGDVETCNTFDPAQDGIDFYESMEGMLVQVNNPVVVGPTNSFDETWIVGDNGANASVRTYRGGLVIRQNDFNPEKVIVEPITGGSPNFDVNDTFTQAVVGPLSYGFDTYRIEATSPLARVSGGIQKESAATPAPNELMVANFNMENLAPTDPPSKFTTLANLIVNNLKSPDLIVAEEIQDNNGTVDDGTVDASLTYSTLISAITASGGPTYTVKQINPVNDQDGGAPGGNIRQAFLFRTDRGLAFVDRPGGTSTNSTQVLTDTGVPRLLYSPGRLSPLDPAFNDSRKPLAGEFTYNGRTIFIVGNHFNSKGGDTPLFGRSQPPVLVSEVQRNQQATIVANFTNQILSFDPNAHVGVIGDLNDYEFANPLLILKNVGLNALVETLPQDHRYSYVFQGNSQDLDHMLVSNILLANLSEYAPIHVNAEFAVQASDHDPEVARFLLPVLPTATPTAPPTATVTNTPIPTSTGTSTVTRTTTATTTSTATTTTTRTSTTTTTSTSTVTVTRTSTALPSNTPTQTRTSTTVPSNTPTQTRTSTAIPSNTPTLTRTSTTVPSNTPTQTRTSTTVPSNTATQIPTTPPTDTPTHIATATATSILTAVPSDTPSATPPAGTTPTVCPIQFSDVPVGSTFYEFIRCLACRGIINGYPDGTFRPNNNVTRGQLSKIVSNAAGFNDPQTDQMFEDVPVGSAFFDYIGRLASRGYISGYPCGGPGEHCVPPGNLPYFRPNANATRGQIAKIVSNAAGFNEPVSGQTFEDVAPGSAFYEFVERLASRNVMSGYPCGGHGEPCVPPENRPYFRPNANATRGQTAKIVANTFFPNCDTPAR